MGKEGEPVGRVGLDGVGPYARFEPLDGRADGGAVIAYGMDRRPTSLVVGGQQVASRAVSRQEAGIGLQ